MKQKTSVRRRVKLADIAKASGVSVSTVSMALRGKNSIPPETRQRILEAARQLGYQPKSPSEPVQHASGKLQTVGLVAKWEAGIQPQANPFYSHVVAGIEEACRHKRINLLYATLPVDQHNLPTEIPRLLTENGVEGLLLVGAFVDETLVHTLGQKSVPVVLVDAYSDIGKYDAVVSNNLQAAYEAVSYLIERGHRHIGIVGSEPDAYPSIRERRQGYLQALQEHGLSAYFADCELSGDESSQATAALLQRSPHISALFGCNDEVAIAAMRAVRDAGRRVPEDLSIIGFDNIDTAQHTAPALSTMHVDKVAMGRIAVQLLRDRVRFPDSPRVTSILHARLIERQSVVDWERA